MSRQFSTAANKIEALQREVLKAKAAFRSYEVIQEKRAPNIVGATEAARNAKAMGDYKGFFNIAEASYQTEMFASLSKLYDVSGGSTSIPRLVPYIEGNLKHMKTDDFKEHNAERQDLTARLEGYMPITLDDTEKIKAKLAELEEPINKLKDLRDKKLAHLEIKEIQDTEDFNENKEVIGDLTYSEIDQLITEAGVMLNYLGSKLNRNVSEFTPYVDTVTDDSERLIELARKAYDKIPSGDSDAPLNE